MYVLKGYMALKEGWMKGMMSVFSGGLIILRERGTVGLLKRYTRSNVRERI